MAVNISLGSYILSDSLIHRLDPRIKICSSLLIMVGILNVHTPFQLLFTFVFIAVSAFLSKLRLSVILSSLKPAVILLCILSLFNLIFVQNGNPLIELGTLTITDAGIWAAFLYPLRFASALIIGSLLVMTTTPTQFSDAFRSLFAPLSKIGLPANEIAMVFSLMLRFIPTISDDFYAISDAQKARGAALSSGSLKERAHAFQALIVALFASSLRHAHNLARALDARCYDSCAVRTQLHPLVCTPKDMLAAGVSIGFVAVLILLSFILP